MGVRRLGDAVRKARGTMSQKDAAELWQFPVATLGAIEQGVDRGYRSDNLQRLDAVLGESAWDLYTRPDPPPADVDAVAEAAVAKALAAWQPRVPGGDDLDELAGFDPVKRQLVVRFLRAFRALGVDDLRALAVTVEHVAALRGQLDDERER